MLIAAIFFIIKLQAAICAQESPVTYKFSYFDNDKILARLEFNSKNSVITKIYLPIFSAAQSINGSSNFTIRATYGSVKFKDNKSIESCPTTSSIYCREFTISHIPNTTIIVEYLISNSVNTVVDQNEGAIVNGQSLFILPIIDKILPEKINIDFSGLKAKVAKIIGSKFIGNINHIEQFNANSLISNWYYFGKYDVQRKTYSELPYLSIVSIGASDKLLKLTLKIAKNNQKFIDYINGYSDRKNKTIILYNIDGHDLQKLQNSGYAQEREKENVFFIKFSNANKDVITAKTISHEYLHQLFNDSFRVNFGPTPYLQWEHFWFNEGFTDYYASLLNLEAKIITLDEYIKSINSDIEFYYEYIWTLQELLIANNAYLPNPITKISEFLTEPGEYIEERVPYIIGRLIANNIDNIIQAKTNNRYDLKELLKIVKRSCGNMKCVVDKNKILSAYQVLVRNNNARWINNYLLKYCDKFERLKFVGKMAKNTVTLDSKYHEITNLGFDYSETLLAGGIVQGVIQDSNAYAAGLRNGNKIKEFKFDYEKICVDIEESNGREKLLCYNSKSILKIPMYIRKNDISIN